MSDEYSGDESFNIYSIFLWGSQKGLAIVPSNTSFRISGLKIAVLGAGIAGVTTAYYLAKAGIEVSVFDRQLAPAEETSFANGGQISVSQPFPWSNPDLPRNLLKWLGRKDAPLVFRLQKDPFMWQWALRFLANSRSDAFYANAGKILRLAQHSKSCLDTLVDAEQIDYHRQQRGILKLFKQGREQENAQVHNHWLQQNGVEQTLLTRDDCMQIEPALAGTRSTFSGGTFSPEDESGDAHQFTVQLEKAAKGLGVTFHYDFDIDRITESNEKITSFTASGQEYFFDKYVLCSGSYSRFLANKVNLKLPVYPVKGYSVSIPIGQSNSAPLTSITDETNHVVISRLGNQLRAAGTAEINGYQLTPNKLREDLVLKTVMDLFPGCGDPEQAERWCGLRPMTTDSVPIIGQAGFDNLYTNTGHGPLGWTLACGSAEMLASILTRKPSKLDIADYSVDRF